MLVMSRDDGCGLKMRFYREQLEVEGFAEDFRCNCMMASWLQQEAVLTSGKVKLDPGITSARPVCL